MFFYVAYRLSQLPLGLFGIVGKDIDSESQYVGLNPGSATSCYDISLLVA